MAKGGKFGLGCARLAIGGLQWIQVRNRSAPGCSKVRSGHIGGMQPETGFLVPGHLAQEYRRLSFGLRSNSQAEGQDSVSEKAYHCLPRP